MLLDVSVVSVADSDLEDGELQKMLTSPLYAQRASVKPDALFSSEQGNLIRSSVSRNANPSNLRGSLLEGDKDHLLNQARSDLAKQELHVESLKKCIGEVQRQTEKQRLTLQDARSTTRRIIYERESSPKHSNPKYARNGRNWESSRTTNRWGLSATINIKSRDNSAAHVPIAAHARTDEFYECFWRFSRFGIKF